MHADTLGVLGCDDAGGKQCWQSEEKHIRS